MIDSDRCVTSWIYQDNLQGTENTVIGNNNAFIQQIIICFIAVIQILE